MRQYLILTPAYQRWREKVPPKQKDDWHSYQSYWARVDQMLCAVDLIWPEFVEYEGFLLRKSGIPENWTQFLLQAKEANWSKSDVEYIINHIHIADFFLNDPDRDNINVLVYDFLAHVISDAWKCKLTGMFPKKNIVVGIASEGIDPEVYAYAQRDQS